MRRAIGWLAAYVLALQAILAGVAPHLAASTDLMLAADPAAIICLSTHGGGTEPTGDIPDGHGTSDGSGHCPLCLSPPPLLVPQDRSRLAFCASATTVANVLPPARALIDLPSRPGGARAPPVTA